MEVVEVEVEAAAARHLHHVLLAHDPLRARLRLRREQLLLAHDLEGVAAARPRVLDERDAAEAARAERAHHHELVERRPVPPRLLLRGDRAAERAARGGAVAEGQRRVEATQMGEGPGRVGATRTRRAAGGAAAADGARDRVCERALARRRHVGRRRAVEPERRRALRRAAAGRRARSARRAVAGHLL